MTEMSDEQNQRLQELWTRVVDRVKMALIAPPVWRALERTVPVVWEGDTFVVGFRAGDSVSGQLAAFETRLAIEKAVRDVTGTETVTYRLIEGDTISDWEYVKARDLAASTGQQQAAVRTQKENTSAGTWDEVYERIARLWTAAQFRGQAAGRARFLHSALDVLEEATNRFYPDATVKPDDVQERGLSRVIERIASYTSSDAALIGVLLFDRLKK
ncbi:MAG: hypothetical protein H8F28_04580 [Fibrella sp.]|nr:hypothetical protein [Armatimonadota bacterium]